MFWDQAAPFYDLFADVYNRKVHEKLKEIVKSEIKHEDNVLECACGTGMLSGVIAPVCASLTATDLSDAMLKRAEKKYSSYTNLTFMKADLLNLPFEDEMFDVSIAANVIHLLDEPLAAIRQLQRVTKKDGKIIIPTYMNKEKSGKESTFSKTLDHAGADFRQAFTDSSYRSFFDQAGYENIRFIKIDGRVPCTAAVMINTK